MPGPSAPVAPEVLRWARESAGLTEEEAARRLSLSPARLLAAETGERPLTLNQARKAAHVYQRPLAALFLPEPPREDPLEVQFRRFRDAPALPWPSVWRSGKPGPRLARLQLLSQPTRLRRERCGRRFNV